MQKPKKALACFLAVLCAVSAVFYAANTKNDRKVNIYSSDNESAGYYEISSNRHTHFKGGGVAQNRLTLNGFIEKFSNDRISLYIDESIGAIRAVDKANGYIWGSTDVEKPDNLNKNWAQFGSSSIVIEYYDSKGTEKQLALADSRVKKSYSYNKNTVEVFAQSSSLKISIKVKIELLDDKLTFSLNDKDINEDENLIKSVYFAPFFGCTVADEIDGYMFVPDGAGALIRYSKSTKWLTGFEKKVYGSDLSIDISEKANGLNATRPNDFEAEAPQVNMAVYGVNHGSNQNAFLATVDNGQEFAVIKASVAGMITDYNWVSARFDYRQKYQQPTGRSGGGVLLPQSKKNTVNPSLTFHFLNGESAGYSGMAVRYRSILREKGILSTIKDKNENIPIMIDIYGADVKKRFLKNKVISFTTANETCELVKKLEKDGIKNIAVVFTGWQKGGINGSDFAETDFEKRVGTKKDFNLLQKQLADMGGRFFYSINPVSGNINQLNLRTQTGNAISKSYIKLGRDNQLVMYPDKYFVKSPLITEYFNKYKRLIKNSNSGLAVRELGNRLYADYTTGHTATRASVKNNLSDMLKNEKNIALFGANEYLLKNTEVLFDIPTSNSQYLFETDTVPFLQIVLNGSKEMFASAANMSFYYDSAVLKMIEYGMYPSFLLTNSASEELCDTPQSDLFSTAFDDWRETVGSIYKRINSALRSVKSAAIVEHSMVAEGIARVTYDNGRIIYVNYTANEYPLSDGKSVPSKGYLTV